MNNMFEDDSDYLEHHGVLGMKWGVRKVRPSSGGSGSSRSISPGRTAVKRTIKKYGALDMNKRISEIRASRNRDNRVAKYINRLSSKQLKKSEKAATSANKWRSLAEKQKNPSDKKLYREFAKADERTSQRYKDLSKKLSSSKVSKSNSKKQIRQNVKAQGRDIEKLRDDEYMRRINKNQKR